MQKKSFYNLITIFLMIGLLVPLPYFSLVQRAEAQITTYQTSGGYNTSGGSGGANLGGGIGGYLSGLAPAIAQLPLCKSKLQNTMQGLFRKSGVQAEYEQYISDISSGIGADDDIPTQEEFEQMLQEDLNKAESIPTYDEEANLKLKDQEQRLSTIEKTQKSLEENDTCLKSIGRMVTKLMLQKITLSTVEWIQTGVRGDGGPAFVENPKSFFKDIAKTEILQFGAELNLSADCSGMLEGGLSGVDFDANCVTPYGKAFLQGEAQAFNRKFSDNARYSLNELIQSTTPQYSVASFNADFSAGGWSAWTYLTSVPANNPIGFQIIASNELGKRLEGTAQSYANEVREGLQAAGGFLGQQVCAYDDYGIEAKDLKLEEHQAGLTERSQSPTGPYANRICAKWEYVTPGQLISDFAQKYVDYPDNNLLAADDLNDAIVAILDAIISRTSNEIYEWGFSGLSTQGSDGSFLLNPAGIITGEYGSQVEEDFSRFQLGGRWLQEHPNFNIRTDVTQALIDEQRIYRQKLEEQNDVLTDLTKTIFQLDYCIPGPHPGWERDSRAVLDAVENTIVSKTRDDFRNLKKEDVVNLASGIAKAGAVAAGAVIGASIGTAALPVIGTVIGAAIGVVLGLIINFVTEHFFGDESEDLLTLYYGTVVNTFTGIPVDMEGEGSSKLRNKQEVTNAFNAIYYRYVDLIHKYYTEDYLPPVAKDAAKEFRKAVAYNQTIADNNDKIVLLNGIVTRLSNIKDGIDALGPVPDPTDPDYASYEEALEPFKSEFARLAQNMVTGDDIASVDSLTKNAKEEVVYVYDDLLTGEYGCEQDLRNNYRTTPGNPNRTWILRSTKRATYPVEVWYDYNNFNPNATLPTPVNPGNTELAELKKYTDKYSNGEPANQMPAPEAIDTGMGYGPGFLSAVFFNYNSGGSGFSDPDHGNGECGQYFAGLITNDQLTGHMLDCLKVTDVLREVDAKKTPSVGRKQYNGQWGNDQKDTSFEQTIGVY